MGRTDRGPGTGPWARGVARRTADLMNALHESGPGQGLEQTVRVLAAHGEREPLALAGEDVDRMRRAARRLRRVFAARTAAQAAAAVNTLLAASAGVPRLTSHGGAHPWHLHLDGSDEGPWDEWFLTSALMALAVLITDRQRPPGGVCSARDCHRVYVDLGGGSARLYCSPRCATRTRVAAHRRGGGRPSRERRPRG